MLCRCGCGEDAGAYPRTRGEKKRGDERPYIRGHWGHLRAATDMIPPNPSGVCLCGCGRSTQIARQSDRKTGDVKGHPKRYYRTHGGRATIRTEITDDLWEEDDFGYVTPCWRWLGGSFNQYGHAKLTMGMKTTGAHRAMYEQMVGPIPDGMEIDHLCRNTSCIRPDHLEVVTHTENIRRSRVCKLTMEKAIEIRSSAENSVVLAERYGVSVSTIRSVRRGATWREE